MIRQIVACVVFFAAGVASAKGQENEGAQGAPATPITIIAAKAVDIEVWEESVGQLEAMTAPMIAAEVDGRISAILADEGQEVEAGQALAMLDKTDFLLSKQLMEADIRRLEALGRGQGLKVGRLRTLVQKKSATQAALDDARAEFDAMKAQIVSAQIRLKQADRNIVKSEIVSPVNGHVDDRKISVGDYVRVGMPLFHLTSRAHLKVRLPYPESLGGVLRRGLPVRLVSPIAPDVTVEAEVTEIRPVITPENRAIHVIVDVRNPGLWEPGASVSGKVQVARRANAVSIPEISVVLRPAGTVVYIVEDGVAKQQMVQTGLRLEGQVEILSGLAAGQVVAMDGAGFLTDGAPVEVSQP
ncbi:MAG: efflux RND transporter periplasmic adaptor subunit [Alphaproteobacteria bacterium]